MPLKPETKRQAARLAMADENIKIFDFVGLMKTYNLLSDNFSKKTFIDVIKYRLAHTNGILPPVIIDKEKELEEIFNHGKYAEGTKFKATKSGETGLYDLHFAHRNIVLYATAGLIFYDLYVKQYEYHVDNVSIAVQPGDYVIDGGAYWGENALFFADEAGRDGRVFSFECSSVNLEMVNKNLELNSELNSRIKLLNRALWSNSSDLLYLAESGPGSFCSDVDAPDTKETQTIAIDDLMTESKIPKIDFIKLDIEGAELECLRGAKNTIQKFKPNLGICVYHKHDDLVTIPQYLKSLVPEYKLYLKHHSDCAWETVLYATINGQPDEVTT